MSNIGEFLSALSGGGARPNRFAIFVNFPAFAGTSDEVRKTEFLANSTQIPGSMLGTIAQPYRGRQIKLAGDRTFDSWECTFVNDTDFAIRAAMERWSNAINSYNDNTGLATPSEYMSTVQIYQLDSQDNRVKEYILRYAFPTVVAPLDLSQDSNDVLELFGTTFEFSDISISDVTA